MMCSPARHALPTALLLGTLSAAALCESDPEPVCEPGRVDDCPCVGAEDGVQVCDRDGSGWGVCDCGDAALDAGPDDAPDAGPATCDESAQADCDACRECAYMGPCAAANAACDAEPECGALWECMSFCADSACEDQCRNTHAAGVAVADALTSCVACEQCPESCEWPSSYCSG